jgi:hypothetical protein
MNAPTSPNHGHDRWRFSAYVLIAVAALFTGYVLGLLGGRSGGGSHVGWPTAPTNPRAFLH